MNSGKEEYKKTWKVLIFLSEAMLCKSPFIYFLIDENRDQMKF